MPDLETLQEFYDKLHPGSLIDKSDSDVINDFQKELVNELNCMTNSINMNSKKEIQKYLEKLPTRKIISIIQLFRIITVTSKVNFEIFFSNWLVSKKIIPGFVIKHISGKNDFSIAIKIKGQDCAITEKNISKLCHNVEIRNELIEFFEQRGLLEILGKIKNHDGGFNESFLRIIAPYQKQGSVSSIRGRKAEEICRELLIKFGLDANIDFNTSDVKVKTTLINKLCKEFECGNITKKELEERTKRITEHKTTREFDIVLPLQNPSIFIQSVFYTSDTGGVAHSTRDQLETENNLIKDTMNDLKPNCKQIGLIDGPGWYYLWSDLVKTLDILDDFFQLKTISTKLRNILHQNEIILPIDFEISGICLPIEERTRENIVKKTCELCLTSIEKTKKELEKWEKRKKIKFENNVMDIQEDKEKIAKEYKDLKK
jgi:hypothetical protein